MFNPILIPAFNPGPMTGEGNNTYLLIGSDRRATLIDAGVGESRHLTALAEQLSRADARLTQVVVTHGHPDHAAGAPALAAACPAARFLKHPFSQRPQGPRKAQEALGDAAYSVDWQRLDDGDRVTLGEEPTVNGTMRDESLVVLHTPGHSPDHLAFWHEASGTVFTGDLVNQGGSVMIHASRGGDLRQYLESLERVRALKPGRLLPAHGPEIGDPDALLAAYVNHRLMRERQVVAALAAGRDTVESIAESIYDGLDPALWPAAHETVRAHLNKLAQEGRAFEKDARWKA